MPVYYAGESTQGLLYRWTEHSILPISAGGELLTLIILQKLTKILRKYLFRHVKGKSMVNIDIANTLGQNLANSESCPILRLL